MANAAAPLIGKPAYQAPFVDTRGFVSTVWLPWLNSLYLAGGALSTAQTTLTALGAALATDQKNIATLQTLSAAATAAIALLNAAMAAVASSLTSLTIIVNAHTLELGLHQARLDALEQNVNTQSIRTVTAAALFGRTDFTIEADATAGAFSVLLPAAGSAVSGEIHNLKKIDWTPNVVTLDGNGALVDGFATIAIAYPGTSLEVQFDGAAWRII